MSTLAPKISRITDILRRDDGISGAMHYTEQISWILFLKFLHDYEANKADEAELEGRTYTYVLAPEYRWDAWACPPDEKRRATGDDLKEFADRKLFPYLKSFKDANSEMCALLPTRSAPSSSTSTTALPPAIPCAKSSTSLIPSTSSLRPSSLSWA